MNLLHFKTVEKDIPALKECKNLLGQMHGIEIISFSVFGLEKRLEKI